MLRARIARLLVPIMLLTAIVSAPMNAGAASIKITDITRAGVPAVGNTVTWHPTVTGGSGNYQFIYTLYKETTAGTGYAYQPKTAGDFSFYFTEVGTYYLQVVAFDTVYDYVSAAKVTGAIIVVGSGPRLWYVEPNTTSVQVGNTVQWTVYGETGIVGASGTVGNVTYEYSLYRKSDDLVINTVRSNPVFAYKLDVPGVYNLRVRATDDVATCAWIETGYLVNVYPPALVLSEVTVSKTLMQADTSVTVSAVCTGGYGALHYYWDVWQGSTVIDSFDTDTSSIVYTFDTPGIYHFSCEVYDQSSQSTGVVTSVDVTVTAPAPFDITSISVSPTTLTTGKPITWTVKLTGGIGVKTVVYTVYKNTVACYTGTKTTSGDSVTITFYPEETGLYTLEAYAYDSKANYTLTMPFVCPTTVVVHDGTSLYLSDLVGTPSKLTSGKKVTWTWQHHNNKGGLKTTYTIYRDGTPIKTVSGFSGYIVEYTIKTGEFGKYTIAIFSEDQVTHQTCSISGGLVDYSYSGALAFTTVVAVNPTLDAPGYAEWLFTVGGNPMGTVNISYEVEGALSGVIATGSVSTTSTGSTASSSVKVFLTAADTYTITLTATDDTPRSPATYTGSAVTVNGGATTAMTIVNLKAVQSEVTVSTQIIWTYGVSGATPPWSVNYEIMFTPTGSTTTVKLSAGTVTGTSVTWTPTATGKYYIRVQGVDALGTTGWYESADVKVKSAPNTALAVTTPTPNVTSCAVGDTITWTFNVQNPIGAYMVFYAIYQADKIMKMSSASDDSPISYVPNNPGLYSIKVYAMDSTGTKCDPKESAQTTVTQSALPLDDLIISIPTVSASHISSPQKVTWTFTVSSQVTDYIVSYQVYKVNGATTTLMIDNVTTKHSFSVYLDETGNYYAVVQAIATDGSGIVSQLEQSEYVVCNLPEELIETVTPDLEPAFIPEISVPDLPGIPQPDHDD